MERFHSVNRRYHRISLLACMLAAGLSMLLMSGCEKGPDKYELRDEAVAIYQQGDYAGAITAFNKALDASNGEVSELQYDILKYRAECEVRTGDYVAAKQTYSALMQLLEDDPDASRAASILEQLGALDKIKEASALIDEGKYLDAYDAFSEYAKLDGTLTGRAAVFNKAVCAEYLGRYEEALELFKEYLAKYPEDAAAKKEADFCQSRL